MATTAAQETAESAVTQHVRGDAGDVHGTTDRTRDRYRFSEASRFRAAVRTHAARGADRAEDPSTPVRRPER